MGRPRIYANPATAKAESMQVRRARLKAEGRCSQCGLPVTSINRKGVPYAKCNPCLDAHAAYMARRKKAA